MVGSLFAGRPIGFPVPQDHSSLEGFTEKGTNLMGIEFDESAGKTCRPSAGHSGSLLPICEEISIIQIL